MKVLLVVLCILVSQIALGEAEGKKKRTDVEIVFNDVVSPNVVAASARSQRPYVPLEKPNKGPFVPEPPAAVPANTTTTLNMALSAATAVLVNTGVFDRIFNQQKFGSLYRPDNSRCWNYPANPAGFLANILNTGTLRVGWFEALPHATSPGPVGLDVSFVKEVAAEIGRHYNRAINVTFVQVNVNPASFFNDLVSGLGVAYDVAIELTSLPSRTSVVNFACPYNTADLILVRGPLDSALQLKSVHDINKPSVVVSAQPAGTTTGELARKLFPLATFLDNGSSAAVFDALVNGRAHVAFDYGIQLRALMALTPAGYSVIDVPRTLLPTPAQFALASPIADF